MSLLANSGISSYGDLDPAGGLGSDPYGGEGGGRAAVGPLFKEILGKAGVLISESSSGPNDGAYVYIVCARPTRSAAALESLLRLQPASRLADFKQEVGKKYAR
jgi:hypothetical protein